MIDIKLWRRYNLQIRIYSGSNTDCKSSEPLKTRYVVNREFDQVFILTEYS